MLRSLRDLYNFNLRASDREFGEIIDFIFDDIDWSIRYAVVRLDDRHVLLATNTMSIPEAEDQVILVQGELDRIINGPIYDSTMPISREQQAELDDIFNNPRAENLEIPDELSDIPLIEMELDKEPMIPMTGDQDAEVEERQHLHSLQSMFGFGLEARDGGAGKLSDVIFDDENWQIDYFVVDTGSLFPGKKVMVSPTWVQDIDWERSQLHVDLSKDTIHNSPEYADAGGITPDYWTNVTDYYNHDRE